jgi:hypothetical protein
MQLRVLGALEVWVDGERIQPELEIPELVLNPVRSGADLLGK